MVNINKRHFVKLSNSVVLFFEEKADEQVVSFGVWDNHNNCPDAYIGELGNWRVNIFSSSDLHLDNLNPDVLCKNELENHIASCASDFIEEMSEEGQGESEFSNE